MKNLDILIYIYSYNYLKKYFLITLINFNLNFLIINNYLVKVQDI